MGLGSGAVEHTESCLQRQAGFHFGLSADDLISDVVASASASNHRGNLTRECQHRCSPASAGAPGTGRQPFSENESNLVNKNSRGALSRGHQHSAVGRAPIPDSSDTPVSVS